MGLWNTGLRAKPSCLLMPCMVAGLIAYVLRTKRQESSWYPGLKTYLHFASSGQGALTVEGLVRI